MPAIDLVLFDMDGVLADTEPLHLAAANRVLASDGVVLTERDATRFLGNTDEMMFDVLRAEHGIAAPSTALARRKTMELLDLLGAGLEANEGVHELVLQLTLRGVDRVVASSSPPELIEAIVAALGLRSSFRGLYSARHVGRGKPAPDLFLHAAKSCGVEPANCLVIEDAPNGIRAARAAGMRVVAVRTPMTAGLDLSDADSVLDSLTDFDCAEWFDDR
jgi:HAD superfamily hydrolase (TIGR01509 family)